MSPEHSIPAETPEPQDVVWASLLALARALGRQGIRVDPVCLSEAANAVRQDWGGVVTYVAKGREAEQHRRAERDRRIVQAFQAGASIARLASEHGVSHRRIHQILAASNIAEMNLMGDFRNEKYHFNQSSALTRPRRHPASAQAADEGAAAILESRTCL